MSNVSGAGLREKCTGTFHASLGLCNYAMPFSNLSLTMSKAEKSANFPRYFYQSVKGNSAGCLQNSYLRSFQSQVVKFLKFSKLFESWWTWQFTKTLVLPPYPPSGLVSAAQDLRLGYHLIYGYSCSMLQPELPIDGLDWFTLAHLLCERWAYKVCRAHRTCVWEPSRQWKQGWISQAKVLSNRK